MHLCALKCLDFISFGKLHKGSASCVGRTPSGVFCLRAVSEDSVHHKNSIQMIKEIANAAEIVIVARPKMRSLQIF